ncbi:MAG: oligosaccharide flippase family protein [Coriobacteriales bacterium]|jgi:O-antigen/teichoic acid export membrane protein|nr:oligosaccharide flippase family protein [Coriobacteriales bacterium]
MKPPSVRPGPERVPRAQLGPERVPRARPLLDALKARATRQGLSKGGAVTQTLVVEARQRRRGVIWNALGSTLFAANTLMMIVVVSRTSSVATVGCFGIALAFAQLLFNIGVFGVSLFQMTDYQKQYTFSDYFWTRIGTCLLMMLVCVVIVVWGMSEPEKRLLTLLLTAFFLLHALGDLYQGFFFQENRLDLSGQALFFRALFALVAFTLVQFLTHDAALSLVAALVASVISIAVWGVFRIKPSDRAPRHIDVTKISAVLKSCFPLFISSFLEVLLFNASRYGIDWLLDDTAQGYFSMIVLPALVIHLVSQFIFKPALNDIALALRSAAQRNLWFLLAKLALAIVLLTIAAALLMPTLGIMFLGVLYAVDLSGLSLQASLLIVGGGLFALNQLLHSVLVVMRRQTGILLAYSVGVAATLFITTLAIMNQGLSGACVAFVLSQIPVLIIFTCVLTRRLKMKGVPT